MGQCRFVIISPPMQKKNNSMFDATLTGAELLLRV
jgi:hypothetical protein